MAERPSLGEFFANPITGVEDHLHGAPTFSVLCPRTEDTFLHGFNTDVKDDQRFCKNTTYPRNHSLPCKYPGSSHSPPWINPTLNASPSRFMRGKYAA